MSITVWSNAPDTPTHICEDARLGGGRGGSRFSGQSGWQLGINFTSLSDLASQLRSAAQPDHMCGAGLFESCRPVRRGEIMRLAIHAHGNSGVVFVNGLRRPSLSVSSISRNHADLHAIGLRTHTSATILFMGCLAGLGPDGTRFLRAISRVWPGRTVVGFATVGYAHGGEMLRGRGDYCTEAGMRDTRSSSGSLGPGAPDPWARSWRNLQALPWASETSPGAKVVRDGSILRGGEL
jgi:hypothetical protein